MSKILVKDYCTGRDVDLETYICRKLDGNDYGVGAVEAASKTSDNNSSALARLLLVLSDKGILGVADISGILHGDKELIEVNE